MPSLPTNANWTATDRTKEQVRQATEQLRAYLSGLLGEDGTIATSLATLGACFAGTADKSAAYTVVAGDRGRLLRCSGTWTLSLTAASTLGNGFAVAVRNVGSGTITVDPAGSETIDGATTIALGAGEAAILICTGSAWSTVGRTSLADGSVTTAKIADANVTAAKLATGTSERDWVLARTADASAGAVGTYVFAVRANAVSFGSTESGSNLRVASSWNYRPFPTTNPSLSGTWRCMGVNETTTDEFGAIYFGTLWLRIS